MRYLVKKVGIGKDAKNVIVSETDNKDVAIAEAKKCYMSLILLISYFTE